MSFRLRSLFAALLFVVATVPAAGQNAEELDRLRKFLSVPDATTIKAVDGALPAPGAPLKVYLATDDEPTAGEQVEKFVAEYNKKASDATRVQLVKTKQEADVVLVQFEAAEKRRQEQDTRLAMDPTMASAPGGTTRGGWRTEIRGYVLVRDAGGYTVIESYKKSVVLEGKRSELRNAFSKLLEKRKA